MRSKPLTLVLIILTILALAGPTSGTAAAPVQSLPTGQTVAYSSEPLRVGDHPGSLRIPEPQGFRSALVPNAAPEDFIITYSGNWLPEAKAAFDYAAGIWSALIDPAVKLSITAYPDTNYGAAFSLIYLATDVPGLPLAHTDYPPALVNHLVGYDAFPGATDFSFYYSQAYDWYYGLDGNTPASKVDFVTVALHEIGHGLGFIGEFSADSNVQTTGWNSGPSILDTFLEDGAGQSLTDISIYPNPSEKLGIQIFGDNTFFDGPKLRSANMDLRAKIDAVTDPHNTHQLTGIGDHLDEPTYNGTPNALMTPTLNPGEAIHDPGPIALGILADLGWKLSANVPMFAPLPMQMMLVNTQKINAVDLWAYLPANQSPGTNFTYAIVNTPAPQAGVSLHDNRYIDLSPQAGWLGQTTVNVRATNLQNLSTTATFVVLVVPEIHSIFLPAVVR